jgi:hypothetical protein
MGRFQRSERGGGQPDPQEALRRAREALARERAQVGEEQHTRPPRDEEEEEVDRAREAPRQHDEEPADDD